MSIIILSKNWYSSAEIAGCLHLHDRTVSNIIQKFEENGRVKVKPRSSHPRRLMTDMIDKLKFLFLSDSFWSSS